MRATMRATAEAHGRDTVVNGTDTTFTWKRNPLIAEAMVDERTVVPNVSEAGKILTFTTDEAIKYGYCDGEAENIRQLIEKEMGKEPYRLVKYKPGFWDNVRGFLMSPILQSILIMLIIGGIYFEMQSPGIGFALGVAITAAVLYFAPLYIDGLAANWEILLFVIGVGLILVEIFVIPGFGITGIGGIVLVVGGLTLSLLNNLNFNFDPVDSTVVTKALLTVISGVVLGFGAMLYLSSKIGSRGMLRKMALNTSMDKKDGYIGVSMTEVALVNKTGTAHTVLRPSGKVRIDDKVYDAVSTDGAFIEKGSPVRVVRYETGQVYVESV